MADDTYDFSTDLPAVDGLGDTPPPSENILDRLREEVSKKIERTPLQIEVPERPHIRIRITPNITQETMKRWRLRAGEGKKDGMNSMEFACNVVAGTCIGIYLGDEEVVDDAGNPVSFASTPIKEMFQASTPQQAVRKMFGLDPHVEAAALAIMDAAGWGDDVETEDPTKGSGTDS